MRASFFETARRALRQPLRGRRTTPSRRRVILVVVAMVACSLMLSALFGERGLLEMLRYESEHERLLGEIASLEEDIIELELEVEALESDPLALERIAREELGLGLEGEVLVFLGSDVERDPRRRTAKAATATSH